MYTHEKDKRTDTVTFNYEYHKAPNTKNITQNTTTHATATINTTRVATTTYNTTTKTTTRSNRTTAIMKP